MAFALSAIVNNVTYSLSDGNPFSLNGADGLGASGIVRLSERGPLQQGVSDLGYRVDVRVITLSLSFRASSASALDTHRSTLARIFQPSQSSPVTLSVTRDDGEVRVLDCHTITGTDIPIALENHPGNLHRAVVQVRADNPYYRAASVTYGTASAYDKTQWATADGQFTSVYSDDNLTNPQYWAYAGGLNEWTLVIKEGGGNTSGTPTLFQAGTATHYKSLGWESGGSVWRMGTAVGIYGTVPAADGLEHVHILRATAGHVAWSRDDGKYEYFPVSNGLLQASAVSLRTWLTNQAFTPAKYWGGTIYNMTLLSGYINDAGVYEMFRYLDDENYLNSASLNNDGDIAIRPTIYLTGYLSNFTITNSTTGQTLVYSGTLPAGQSLTIDLSGNVMTAETASGSVVLSNFSDPIDLYKFRLQPGVNTMSITSGSIGPTASVVYGYEPKYLSF